jgi:uncharacterized protein YbjT (DUF2867 family)
MPGAGTIVVTGAFGFAGRWITRRLVDSGERVVSLTNHLPRVNEFGDRVTPVPFNFDKPEELRKSLEGADVLYNTYWIRYPQGGLTFDAAVQNSRTLIQAAKDAGVRKLVHISIANPSITSPRPYYRGKAQVEEAIHSSGLSYSILRPALIFGDHGVLINDIAWFLRHMPTFVVPGSGDYRLRPVFVGDLADLAVRMGARSDNVTVDAVGPETYAFNDLVALLARTVGSKALILHLPPGIAYLLSRVLGFLVRDVVLTRNEVNGLMDNLLVTDGPPTGDTTLSEWLAANADWIGSSYMRDARR